jgi:hypothetical protein
VERKVTAVTGLPRSTESHWGAVAALILGGLVAVPVLYMVADAFAPSGAVSSTLFYGGALLLLASPAVLVASLIVVVNVLLTLRVGT